MMSHGKGAALAIRIREIGSELHSAYDEPVPTGSLAFPLGRGLLDLRRWRQSVHKRPGPLQLCA